MWIKSQSRTVIVKADMVYVGDDEYSNKVYCGNGNSEVMLGKYKDSDRAIEVLDTICDRLEDGMDFSENDNGQVFNRHMIFEMPVI